MSTKKNIETIYPLSPMQQGMLFHTLYEPQSALYFEQLSFLMLGEVDAALLQQAWQNVVNRHPALRTAFVWKGQEKPLQVVLRHVELPWQVLDWRELPAAEQATELERYLRAEREAGFDLAQAPLCRATLIHLAEERYRFVWSNHHLLMDGWSLPIVLREAFRGYEMVRMGQEMTLPPVRPYRSFINWLQQQDEPAAEAFWREKLRNFTTPTPLVDHAGQTWGSGKNAGTRYHTWRQVVPADLLAQLQATARTRRITLGTLLYGAWALLLQRYSNSNEVLFGATQAGRPHDLSGAEEMVGLFINTLPLRLSVPADMSAGEWLQTIQEQQVALRAHEHTPLAQIQEWSELPNQSALFESLLVLENYPVDSARLREEGLSFTVADFQAKERTNYPLTLALRLGETMENTFHYDAALFTEAQVARIATHFVTVLQQLAADVTQPLRAINILTPEEQTLLLHTWNDTAMPLADPALVPQRVAAWAAQQPDAPAVVQGERCVTYGELERRANQVAHTLQKMGVGPERRVGLLFAQSPELLIGALAVMKAGGAYVPLDPALPKGRLQFMVQAAETAVILTTTARQKRAPAGETPLLLLDDEAAYAETETAVVPAITPQNLAYVIFTSGSTGQPKGVAVPHAGLRNLVEWHQSAFGILPTDRATLLANPAFDASVWEMWSYLVQGASLHIPVEEGLVAPAERVAWLAQEKITHCFMPTPLAEAALHTPWPAEIELRYLFAGGDRLRSGRPAKAPFRLVNLYGPTEDTVIALYTGVDGQPLPPIGRPLSNKKVYILDKNLHPVPVGVPGELYISGAGLARGYLGRPGQTAASFVPNPFAADGDKFNRLYKTGDLVRYRPDGNVEFLGRIDNQVKIGGYRIELGEIEATLVRHSGVKEAAVIVWENRAGTRQLLAYITAARRIPPSLRELERFLKRSLPEYMLPKSFFVLPEMPLTPNGKLDRKALPLPEETVTVGDVVPPRTETEKQLVPIWQQVLGLEEVGIENNFFELGGDSILSIQLVSRATRAGLHFSVKQVFQYPTIAALAPHVREATAVQAEQGAVTGQVPITPIQSWFFAQPLPQPHHFNQAFLLVERQPMQPDLVEQALNHLVLHHDALRMRYRRTETGWEQVAVAAGEPVPFLRVDLSGTPDGDVATAVTAVADEVQASLDLSAGLLVRGVWFDLGGERPSRFLWVIHHLVVDGFSWRILLDDLQTAYHQLRRGETLQLPPKSTSYKYWAERLTRHVKDGAFAGAQQTWLDLLQSPAAPLPVDTPDGRKANTEGSVAEVDAALTQEETQWLLQEAPKALNTEINDLLLTALAQALTRWAGSDALLVELEGHGRLELFDDVDLSRTVGWFTSMYPARLDLAQAADPGAALKAVKEQLRRIPDQGASYGALRYLQGDPAFADLPHPEIRFNYMGQYDQSFGDEVSLIPAQEPSGAAVSPDALRPHLLDVAGGVLREQMRFTWFYSSAVHRPETITRLANDFVQCLRDIINHAQTAQAAALTPSDFPAANLDQAQLDSFLTAIGSKD